MSSNKLILIFFFLIVICMTQSGCALFSLPGQIVGGLFNLFGKALDVANGLPKPPPWMFI